MKRIVSLCIIIFAAMSLMAQTVTNVVAEQVGKQIVVSYLLDKQSDISIQYSTDGGNTYRSMSHTSGDVGRSIASGQHTITWDVLADVEKLVCSNLVFKVTPSGGEKLTFTVNGVSFTMIQVEGGTFTMGATREQGSGAESDEKPTHSVTLSTYYLGETEVTQALWQAVMGTTVRQQRDKANTSWSIYGEGDNYPMYYINYEECKTFVSKLNSLLSSQLGGKLFALPTEAQWEYAARGGNKSQGYKYSGSNSLSAVAWYTDNSGGTSHTVKTKQANELGLYDMSGNVWEWCQDWYCSYSSSSQTNPTGCSSGSRRVIRGGSWGNFAGDCRVSYRISHSPSYRSSRLGLRLCLLP